MSKLNEKYDQVILKTVKELNGAELKVFLAWFTDSTTHNSPQVEIAKRTGHSKDTVSRAFQSLIDRGFVEEVRKTKRSVDYKMTRSFLDSLDDVSTNKTIHTVTPTTKHHLDDPRTETKPSYENELQEKNMDKFTKIFNTFKAENDRWLSKELIRELVSTLHANDITEDELESFGRKLKKIITSKINGYKNMGSSEREDWSNNMHEAFDLAHAEFFPLEGVKEAREPARSSEDLEAIQSGFVDAQQKREYSSVPRVETQKEIYKQNALFGERFREIEKAILAEKDPARKKELFNELKSLNS